MNNKICVFILFFILGGLHLYANRTPQTVPDPKKTDKSTYISDPDHYISSAAEAQLNSICRDIETQTGMQYAIVVLKMISYEWTVYDFAVKLFTEWGIGQKNKDNGLLLLIVIDTHDWRFVTGYGTEHILTDALLRNLGENYIVPNFRNQDYDRGLIEVSKKIEEIVTSENALSLVNYYQYIEPWWQFWIFMIWGIWGLFFLTGLLSFYRKRKKYIHLNKEKIYTVKKVSGSHREIVPDDKRKIPVWGRDRTQKFISIFVLSAIIPAFSMYFDSFFSNPAKNTFWGLYGFMLVYAGIVQFRINKNTRKTPADTIDRFFCLRAANKFLILRIIFFPVPFLLYYFVYKYQLRRLKLQNVNCPVCETTAMPAHESIYSQILNPQKLFENQIRSLDHKIYQCANMHTVEVPFPGKKNSLYNLCSFCGTKALRYKKRRTVTPATYTSTGLGEKEYVCKYCNKKTFTNYIIPMRTQSSSSSSSGGSSSGGSSGSSWGGGRTGGGGAGGKW